MELFGHSRCHIYGGCQLQFLYSFCPFFLLLKRPTLRLFQWIRHNDDEVLVAIAIFYFVCCRKKSIWSFIICMHQHFEACQKKGILYLYCFPVNRWKYRFKKDCGLKIKRFICMYQILNVIYLILITTQTQTQQQWQWQWQEYQKPKEIECNYINVKFVLFHSPDSPD